MISLLILSSKFLMDIGPNPQSPLFKIFLNLFFIIFHKNIIIKILIYVLIKFNKNLLFNY